MKPLVSVVMPSYNGGKFIGEAIESVISQTYENWELIIVEDCSEDDSQKIIQNYTDQRIRLFCNERNQGIAESTNRGIRKSRGKYIALLDDDDIAEKERLSWQVDYLESHPEIDFLGGRSRFIDEEGAVVDYSCIPRNNPRYIKAMLLFQSMDFLNGTAMIRKEFMERHHLYYQNHCYGMQDFRFYIESSKVGNISTINRFLLRYRVHPENDTKRNFRVFQEERKQAYAYFQQLSLRKSGFSLQEESLAFLQRVLAERDGGCSSARELKELHQVFCELLRQGAEMGIDYLDELEHVCKVKLAGQLIRIKDLFS